MGEMKTIPHAVFLIAGLAWFMAMSVFAAAGQTTNLLVVDFSHKQQTMDNFGANDAWSMQKIGAWSEPSRSRIADLLFSTNLGIGLSCWRFNLGAGINHISIENDWRTVETFETAAGKYDWNRQANERWFLRAAKARGVRQFAATVYSPPGRLTRNGLSNLGSDRTSTTNLKPGAENEFAAYLADILRHFRDNPDPGERIDFDYVFPVNEPQWDWNARQEGNRASNDDLKRIYAALKQRLDESGLHTKILGPESGCIPDMYAYDKTARQKWHADYGNYLACFCGDAPTARCLSGIVTYHSYWSDAIPGQLVPHRERLGRTLAAFPGWKLWQSEYCIMEWGRDLTMAAALRMAKVIHYDLTLANASAWQWWEAVANDDYKSGLIYTDYQKPGDGETIHESKILWVLGNFSRFIRPGMQRVEVHGNGPQSGAGILASAYVNPDGSQLVIVLINPKSDAERVRIAFDHPDQSAVAVKPMTSYTTSAAGNLQPSRVENVFAGLRLPPYSVVTLVSGPG